MKLNLFCARALILLSSTFITAGTAFAGTSTITAVPGAVTVTGPASTTLPFHLKRTGDTGYDAWLHYATVDDSAQAGEDYTAASGQLHLPAAQTAVNVPITVFGSRFPLADKTLKLNLTGIVGTGPAPSFTTTGDYTVGSMSYCVIAVDVNGDGRSDLITSNAYDSTISVLVNTTTPGAAPTFSSKADFGTGPYPMSVTAADVNGDGKPDLITANADSNSVSVLVNQTTPGAAPTFAPKADFATGTFPSSVTSADVNGDGKPDLVTANRHSNSVSVLVNQTTPGAAPTFAPKADFATGTFPSIVTAADVNGDGKPDLVTANRDSNSVSVLVNQTTPGTTAPDFAAKTDLPVGSLPHSVTTADVNGDGRPDLIIAVETGNTVSVLMNQTTPGAAPVFTPKADFATSDSPIFVTTGDVNGDGKVDLITGSFSSSGAVSVLVNTTPPGLAPTFETHADFTAGSHPESVAVADVDGDGKPDLIAVHALKIGSVSLLRNTTTFATAAPAFAAAADFAVGPSPTSVTTADINGDSKPDLITANINELFFGTTSLLINTAAPGAAVPRFVRTDVAVGGVPESVAAADVNGDGKPDLIIADAPVPVLLNTTMPGATAPTFAAKAEFPAGRDPVFVTTTDVNGDGKTDVIVANEDSDSVSVLVNATAPGATAPEFLTHVDFATLADPESVAAADVNGDGKPDLITADRNTDSVSVLLNKITPGTTSLAPTSFARTDFAVGDYPASVATADINGDGKIDVIVMNEWSNYVSVLLNTMTPGATVPDFIRTDLAGVFAEFVTTADVNGDGKPDLVMDSSVLLNTTTPGATTPTFATATRSATGVAVTTADVNGDGNIDLIATGASSPSTGAVSVLMNRQYAVSVPASVTGTIHYSIPVASGVPAAIDFGPQLFGGAAANRTFTLENTGNTGLTVSFAMSGANSADFDETDDCGGLLAAGASCVVTVAFQPGAIGARNATLTLTSNGADSPQDIALTGSGDRRPVAAGGALTVHTGATATGTFDATDADGDPLLFSLATAPAHGTVTITDAATGAYRYQAAPDYAGSDAFTFIASDGAATSAPATVSITIADAAPVASDADLKINWNTTASGKLEAADADGDQLTFRLADQPEHGTAEVNPDGSFTYQPAGNYFGADRFTFVANDGALDSAAATVAITVDNGPLAARDVPLSVHLNTEGHGKLAVAGADGGALTFAKAGKPRHGKATVNPDGTFTYTPDRNYVGHDSFAFIVSEGVDASPPAAVHILVTDGMPVVPNSHLTALAGVPMRDRLQATDPDGDPFTFRVIVAPDHGRLAIHPDGRYTYTPDAGFTGSDSFLFRADDGALQSDPGVVGIEVLSEAEATGAHDPSSGGAGGLGALGLLGLGLMVIRRRITRN